MADRCRLVTIDEVGRARLVIDLNNLDGVYRARDSFTIQPGNRRGRTATGIRRYDGDQALDTLEGNITVGATFIARDQNADPLAAAAVVERILSNAARVNPRAPLFIEWRPHGLDRSAFFRLRGPGTVTPNYVAARFAGTTAIPLEASWPAAPLAEGLPMDLLEDFRPDPEDATGLADYTVGPGAATVVYSSDPNVRGLRSVNGQTATELRHTGRGYDLYDGAWRVGFLTPANLAAGTFTVAVGKKLKAADSYVYARINQTSAGNFTIELWQRLNGGVASTVVATVTPGIRLDARRRYWLELLVVGETAKAAVYTKQPRDGNAPDWQTTTGLIDTSLAGAGAGWWLWQPGDTASANASTGRAIELVEEPYTFQSSLSPLEALIRKVPGNAPASADVRIYGTGAPFGVIGWRGYGKDARNSLAFNGDVADLDGWATAPLSGGSFASGATITRVASGGPLADNPYARLVTAGTNLGGAFRIYDQLHQGSRYTVEFYARIVSGAWSALPSVNGVAGAALALGAADNTWKRFTYTFVADSTRRVLELVFKTTSSAAGDLHVSRLRCWEGGPDDEPATLAQTEGRGAFPPFAYLSPAADDTSQRVGFTSPGGLVDDARLASGVATGTLRYAIDPALLPAPQGERDLIDFEVYASLSATLSAAGTVQATITPALIPKGAGGTIYPREFGSAGRTLTFNGTAGSTLGRVTRLGTIPFASDSEQRGRYDLEIKVTRPTSAYLLVLDALILVPVKRRMSSPSGKVLDATYPVLLVAGGAAKTILSNGRGLAHAADGTIVASTGLAGEPIELEPGDNELAVLAATGVADDPSDPNLAYGLYGISTAHVRVTPRYRLLRDR